MTGKLLIECKHYDSIIPKEKRKEHLKRLIRYQSVLRGGWASILENAGGNIAGKSHE